MMTLLAIFHIIFAFLLIGLVLLQDPKSSGTGGVFGAGGSNTLLGATGGANFLEKLTRYSAIFFGITCLSMTIWLRPSVGSVLDAGLGSNKTAAPISAPVSAAAPASNQSAPAAPATTAPAAPTTWPAFILDFRHRPRSSRFGAGHVLGPSSSTCAFTRRT